MKSKPPPPSEPEQVLWEELRIRPTDAIKPLPILIGLCALLVGAMVYIVDRPPESAWLVHWLSGNRNLYGQWPRLFGVLSGSLPAFVHVFAFSLVTAGVMERNHRGHAWPCLAWFLVNLMFEMGQKYPEAAAMFLPKGHTPASLSGRFMNFFTKGTFDPMDILAFAAGALAAFAFLTMTGKKE